MIPNGDPRVNNRPAAYPHTVAKRNGEGKITACVTVGRIRGVCGGIELDAWTKENIVSNRDFGAVEDNAVKVAVEVVPNEDVAAVIHTQRRRDAAQKQTHSQSDQNPASHITDRKKKDQQHTVGPLETTAATRRQAH